MPFIVLVHMFDVGPAQQDAGLDVGIARASRALGPMAVY